MKLLNKLLKALKINRKTTVYSSLEEQWLANSTDLVDLERRQKMLMRGQAPFQVQANQNLSGWV